ncbi:component of the counting factor complex [Heterostelium album PN500]|uniref:Component of the counting factor complex n=1 Tax=Heterostelium pallidum (strain ATCC 26659 / Pp 5 / PN500) TaxID=670386 RepID=D3BAL2_HETP5|nr:component of the counting factor complex [Heterostelium album PN500]EFA81599.1 component of the counting factor complex [Heterostelium album PN500]|eukprot:XP_020433716.1 component of the counting factor complex [Heterostelium album PN500]
MTVSRYLKMLINKMFKLITATILVLSMVICTFGTVVPHQKTRAVTLDLCPTCVDFMDESIQELINIIMNAGVLGSCSDLCSKLSKSDEQVVCDLLCDYVGIEEFIKIIQDADPDPVYICEQIKVCPVRDSGNANITSVIVDPPAGPVGTQFTITVTFQVLSQLGTGQIAINVIDPFGNSFGGGDLLVNTEPNTYNANFQFQAQPSESEPFQPGNYTVQAAVCEGTCGSPHPHSKIYDIVYSGFNITQSF